MLKVKKSVLLLTSSANDIQHSGGKILVTGLNEIKKEDILYIGYAPYRAEVQQQYNVGNSSYTPTASTRYTVKIGAPTSMRESFTRTLKSYTYVTPPVISTIGATAADQREFIHGKIIEKINNDLSNYATAATAGSGNGFIITDDAGYYPARINGGSTGRKGANTVIVETNSDGTGFVAGDIEVRIEAVYSFGEGTRMLQDKPILHAAWGPNLVSGELDAPKTITGLYAVPGQKYNAFFITGYTHASAIAVSGQIALVPNEYVVFVDNGAGSATTNATGYATFERDMLRELFGMYAQDPSAYVDFFDNYPTFAGSLAPAPTGVAADVNVVNTGKNSIHYFIIGTQTIVNPVLTSTGLQLDMDATSTDGAEYSAPIQSFSPKVFTSGKDEFAAIAKLSMADVSDAGTFLFGFRKKAAYNATYTNYSDYVALGWASSPGDIAILTGLNGTDAADDTLLNFADGESHKFEVRVGKDRIPKFFIDDAEVTGLQTPEITLDADDDFIFFIQIINGASSAPGLELKYLAVIPSLSYKI